MRFSFSKLQMNNIFPDRYGVLPRFSKQLSPKYSSQMSALKKLGDYPTQITRFIVNDTSTNGTRIEYRPYRVNLFYDLQ